MCIQPRHLAQPRRTRSQPSCACPPLCIHATSCVYQDDDEISTGECELLGDLEIGLGGGCSGCRGIEGSAATHVAGWTHVLQRPGQSSFKSRTSIVVTYFFARVRRCSGSQSMAATAPSPLVGRKLISASSTIRTTWPVTSDTWHACSALTAPGRLPLLGVVV